MCIYKCFNNMYVLLYHYMVAPMLVTYYGSLRGITNHVLLCVNAHLFCQINVLLLLLGAASHDLLLFFGHHSN